MSIDHREWKSLKKKHKNELSKVRRRFYYGRAMDACWITGPGADRAVKAHIAAVQKALFAAEQTRQAIMAAQLTPQAMHDFSNYLSEAIHALRTELNRSQAWFSFAHQDLFVPDHSPIEEERLREQERRAWEDFRRGVEKMKDEIDDWDEMMKVVDF